MIAGIGFAAPAIMLVAFFPMLFIAAAYYYLNRADPTAAPRSPGPPGARAVGRLDRRLGIIIADIIVMANLSEIAGIYTFELFGYTRYGKWETLAVGVAWIVVMTWICYIGIEVSARIQWGLLGAEIVTLLAFAVVAFYKVYTDGLGTADRRRCRGSTRSRSRPARSPQAMIVAIFIYWGWDSTSR